MTTLDRPPTFSRLRCRRSILSCEPRYRRVRLVLTVSHLAALHHAGLRSLMRAHWHAVRAHSSWSRA